MSIEHEFIAGEPEFPPLLNGIKVKGHPRPFERAQQDVEAGKAQAGDFFWTPSERFLECALVLEPETHTTRSLHMLFAIMVAFGDSFGALAPPEVGMFYRWPATFVLNEAEVGRARIAIAPTTADDEIPAWLVVGIKVELKGKKNDLNPGENMGRTNLFEEGVGDLPHRQLLESFSRHFLVWIHTWNEDGFKPVHENWVGRSEGKNDALVLERDGKPVEGEFFNLDDDGNLLIKSPDGKMQAFQVRDFTLDADQ